MNNESLFPTVTVEPDRPADAVVIWLHGLGDSGHGFAPIVKELNLPSSMAVRFIFPHAPQRPITLNQGLPMQAWFDIRSLDMDKRVDPDDFYQSAEVIQRMIDQQVATGIDSRRIVLAGFSQGGVVALHVGLTFDKPLAGVMGLSCYMFRPQAMSQHRHDANRHCPVLLCHGDQDEVVPIQHAHTSRDTLMALGYQVEWHRYPMAHNVCQAEVKEIARWLQQRLAG